MAGARGPTGPRSVTDLRSGTWTLLFLDVVDSTALRSRLGDDDADSLQARIDGLVARVVADHCGLVVKGLGDGSMCAFEGAADAVAAAIEVQQLTERLRRRDGEVHVRVGIAVGDAAAEGDDLFGTPVVEAARLCSAAAQDQILCTQVTQLIAGSRSGATFTSVGDLELKGLPDPVATVEVGWAPLAEEGAASAVDVLPLPPLLVSNHRMAFAGHAAELAALDKAWQLASTGVRATALLAGEPGIGKSRLAAELGRVAHAAGATVLFGRCDDELGSPFQPFVEALDFLLEHCPSDLVEDRLGPLPGELTRLCPRVAECAPSALPATTSDPETERARLFDAVDGWLAALSRPGPVLLVLDDIHWAARPTLHLLKHLVRSASPGPLLIVGTYRDTDLDRTSPLTELLADFRREPSVARVSVGGLASGEIVDLMEQVAGHVMDEDGRRLAQVIHEESEGNCFFVGEILRHLSETGAVFVDDGGRWTVRDAPDQLGIPEGVREVVGRRIDQLPELAGALLQTAAVLGRDFDLDVLLALTEADEDEVLEAMDVAADARLIDETGVGRYRFSHALVRSTLYDELRATRRARLHRRVGEAIESVYPDDIESHLPELAHHFARAAAGDNEKAFDYALRAGRRALGQLAHDEAAERFESALELLDDDADPRRAEVLLGLGRARAAAGHAGYRETLVEAGRLSAAQGDAEHLAEAALALHRGYFGSFAVVDDDRLELTSAAIDAVGDTDPAVRARLLANLATEELFKEPLERRIELSDEAVLIARGLGDPATLAHVLRVRHNAIWDTSTLEARIADMDELGELAALGHDPQVAFWAGWGRWATAIEVMDPQRAADGMAIFGRIAGEARLATHQWILAFTLAGQALIRGELGEAERLATEAADVGAAAGEADALFYYGTQLFFIRREQSRLAEIDDLILESVAALPSARSILGLTALLHIDLGRADEGRAVLSAMRDDGFNTLPRDQTYSSALLAASEICYLLGEAERADELLPLVISAGDMIAFNGLVPLGAMAWAEARCLATLGRPEEAAAAFARAVDRHDRMAATGLSARSRLEWAEALVTVDPERSAVLAAETRQVADALGLRAVADRAAALS